MWVVWVGDNCTRGMRGMPLTSTEYYVVLPNQLLIVEDLF